MCSPVHPAAAEAWLPITHSSPMLGSGAAQQSEHCPAPAGAGSDNTGHTSLSKRPNRACFPLLSSVCGTY